MGKTMLGAFFGLVMVGAGASAAFALQAGGVEIGDLETGSVVGQSFKELDVDAQLFAIEIGTLKTWYPPVTIIDFKVRPGRPVLLKVTNNATAEHGFEMTDATNAGSPTVMKARSCVEAGRNQVYRDSDQRHVLCHSGEYADLSLSPASGACRRQDSYAQVIVLGRCE